MLEQRDGVKRTGKGSLRLQISLSSCQCALSRKDLTGLGHRNVVHHEKDATDIVKRQSQYHHGIAAVLENARRKKSV